MSAKFEVEQFDGKEDLSLWKKKMKVLLVQQKTSKVLDDKNALAETMTAEKIA